MQAQALLGYFWETVIPAFLITFMGDLLWKTRKLNQEESGDDSKVSTRASAGVVMDQVVKSGLVTLPVLAGIPALVFALLDLFGKKGLLVNSVSSSFFVLPVSEKIN